MTDEDFEEMVYQSKIILDYMLARLEEYEFDADLTQAISNLRQMREALILENAIVEASWSTYH